MAVSVETGNFVADTGGATTTVSTGFQGKAIILFTHTKTAEGESAGAAFSIGAADNAGNVGVLAWAGDDAVSTVNAGKSKYSNRLLQFNSDGTPTQVMRIASIAFNSTPNFVVTFNITPPSAYEISYILIGGDDIEEVFVGNTTVATSISTQNVTGVGFQPDVVFCLSGSVADSTSATAKAGLGMAVSAAKQWAWSGIVIDAATTSAAVNGMSILFDDAIMYGQTVTNGEEFRANFLQFTADGFDLDVTNAAPANYQFTYLAIKGGQWDCGVQAKPTTATTQSVTSTAFTPKLVGWFMSSATALDTATSECTSTWGAWDGTTEVYAGSYHNDAINTVALSAGASTKVLREIGYTAEADGTSLNSDGWTITWTATGTAYLVPWWALGDNAAAEPAEFESAILNPARVTMTLTSPIVLASSVSGAATTSGDIATSITTAASVSGTATVTGGLTTSILAAGTASGIASVSGTMTTVNVFDTEIFADADASGALTTSITCAASVSGVATGTSSLTTAIRFASSVTATATGAAELETEIRVAASVSGVATTEAELFLEGSVSEFDASIIGLATVEGDLSSSALFEASVSGAATTAGILDTSILLASSVAGAATTASALDTSISMSASITGFAETEAELTAAIRMAASIFGIATCEASFTVPRAVVTMSNLRLSPSVSMAGFQISPAVTVDSVSLGPV